MTYPRKGSITLGEVKSMLAQDPVFASLSDTQKKDYINAATKKIASFRNSLEKEDFQADTVVAQTYPES